MSNVVTGALESGRGRQKRSKWYGGKGACPSPGVFEDGGKGTPDKECGQPLDTKKEIRYFSRTYEKELSH